MYSGIFKQNTQIIWRGCTEETLKKLDDEGYELKGTPYDGYILKKKDLKNLLKKCRLL